MRKSPYRAILILVFMFFLAMGNVIKLYDRYPVRPIMVVSLVSLGMLLGAILFGLVRIALEKRNKQE
ncbi:hypothetical protein BH11BAC7_BH11BAC7_32340 [soil metagenome]